MDWVTASWIAAAVVAETAQIALIAWLLRDRSAKDERIERLKDQIDQLEMQAMAEPAEAWRRNVL